MNARIGDILLFECQQALEAVRAMRKTSVSDDEYRVLCTRADRLVDITLQKLKDRAELVASHSYDKGDH